MGFRLRTSIDRPRAAVAFHLLFVFPRLMSVDLSQCSIFLVGGDDQDFGSQRIRLPSSAGVPYQKPVFVTLGSGNLSPIGRQGSSSSSLHQITLTHTLLLSTPTVPLDIHSPVDSAPQRVAMSCMRVQCLSGLVRLSRALLPEVPLLACLT